MVRTYVPLNSRERSTLNDTRGANKMPSNDLLILLDSALNAKFEFEVGAGFDGDQPDSEIITHLYAQ